MKKLYILICSLAITLSVFAGSNPGSTGGGPDGSVAGIIKDKESQKPVEYANVVIYKRSDSTMITGTVSDASGNFLLANIPNGNYYVEVGFIGYNKTKVQDIEISKKNKAFKIDTIFLMQASTSLNEVNVVSEKTFMEYKIDKKVVNVSKNPASLGGSAADALQNIPSVNVDIDGNVSLRGSTNFKVLIDGKPSVISGSDALKQIPASSIENIEIITNPSAKYDPDGTSGIINVILKKNKQDGVNGIVNASAGTGNKYSADSRVNYRIGKANITAAIEYMNHNSGYLQEVNRVTQYQDSQYVAISKGNRHFGNTNFKGEMGFEYALNDLNNIAINLNAGRMGFTRNAKIKYQNYINQETQNIFSQVNDELEWGGDFYAGNLNYEHKFNNKGKALQLNANYNNWKGSRTDYQEKNITDNTWNNILLTEKKQRKNTDPKNWHFTGSADYVWPLNDKSKVEAGYKSDLDNFNSTMMFEDFTAQTNQWINNSDFSNEQNMYQETHAGYITYNNQILDFGIQLGLRAEYYKRNFELLTTNTNYYFDMFNFFPSVHISRDLKNNQQLQLSYSRRIDRPDNQALNPFPNFVDDYYVSVGNPYLKPEFTHMTELNYKKNIDQSFVSVNMYHSIRSDIITRTLKMTSGTKMITSFENLDNETFSGAELTLYWDIKKWWKVNVSADGFYHVLNGSGSMTGEKVTSDEYSWTGKWNNIFNFKTFTTVQLSGNYQGKISTSNGSRPAMWMANIALKQQFLNQKLSVTLTVNDIFKTNNMLFDLKGSNYTASSDFYPEGRVVMVSLSYKINNYKRTPKNNQVPSINFGAGA